jgi:SAM-dependent methyltransferase
MNLLPRQASLRLRAKMKAKCGMNDRSSDAFIAPAVARNRNPILDVLRHVLPEHGTVLEIASGSGEHVVYFAAGLPLLSWQPSEVDPLAVKSISAHRASVDLPNLLAPIELDVEAMAWPVTRADAVVCINMLHIAPWSAAEGLMAGAGRVLPPGGVLYLYGPFSENGRHTAPSNAAFNASLRARNPDWGVRDLIEVTDLAVRNGFELIERIAMPANNLSVVFHRIGE